MCCLFKYSTPLSQYFVVVILAAITPSGLLGYVCISLAHLDLGIFSHSSLQICFVKLDRERHHHASRWGWCSMGDELCLVSARFSALHSGRSSIFVSSDHRIFVLMLFTSVLHVFLQTPHVASSLLLALWFGWLWLGILGS